MNPEQARNLLLANLRDLRRVELPLADAVGLALADDLITILPEPPFDRAAKDGFAVVTEATGAASLDAPVRLAVTEIVAAGELFANPVSPQNASKIMTGAALPPGADAVIALEDAQVVDGVLRVTAPVVAGANVQEAGETFNRGEFLLQRGQRMTPVALALAASAGVDAVPVRPRPLVGIVPTGSELVPPGTPLEHGQIPASSPLMLAEQVRLAGGVPRLFDIVGDRADRLAKVLDQAMTECDVVISTGGVGPGQFDVVAAALGGLGVEILFSAIDQRPGKRMIGAIRDNVTYLGLPGSPAAAMVCFEIYARPIIRHLLDQHPYMLLTVDGYLDTEIEKNPTETMWLPVRRSADPDDPWRFVVCRTPNGGLRDMIDIHGLAELPAGRELIGTGDQVPIHLLDKAFQASLGD